MGAISELLSEKSKVELQEDLKEGKENSPAVVNNTAEGNAERTTNELCDNIIPENGEKVNSFWCNIDTVAYKNKKAAKNDTALIVNRTKQKIRIKNLTPFQLSEAVTNGYSFTTAALKGAKESGFVSQQLAVLDIDNSREDIPVTTVEDAVKVLSENNIDYSFMYYSFSHSTAVPKFRIVCVLSEAITEPQRAKELNKYLISLFPQSDPSCHNLDRFYYGTDKGLATEVHNRTATITVPEAAKSEPTEGNAPPISEPKQGNASENNNFKEGAAHPDKFNLTQAIRDFNLLEYVERTTGTQGTRKGKDVLFNPCPLCGHQGDFYIDTERNLYKCHGASNRTGGNIINYLEQRDSLSRKAAREHFIYDIMGQDRKAQKEAFKEAKKKERVEQQTGRTDINHAHYMYINGNNETKVNCPFLAEYIKDTVNYIFVSDSAKDTVQRYIYTDGYYKQISDEQFKGLIKQYIPLENQKIKDISEVFNLISIDNKFVRRSQLNANENIINFKNGVLHLDTMQLKPHSPEYLCTKRIPCNYIPNAQKPVTGHFDKYITHLTAGDKGKASIILQFLGMAISNIKGYRPKKALFMTGEGDTGKSVIRSLAAKLVGEENNSSVTLETLEARFGTSIVYGKRLVGSADMNFMTIKELSTFKQITGGDQIFAEFKGENGFTYEFDGVVWFCMNQLPKFGGDKGEHVYERMVIVECNPNKPEVADTKLGDKLLTEADYIVSIAINELQKVIDNGYKYIIPESCKNAREFYKTKNNSFLQFFEECTTERPQGKISDSCTTKRFYDVYVAWCEDNNHGRAETKQAVTKVLEDMGKGNMSRTNTARYWSDFTLTLETKQDYKKVYGYDNTTKL